MTAAIQRMRLRDPAAAHASGETCGSQSSQSISADQESMLRMQYALAIIRLVNGISDSAQKGTVAKSVAHLAENAGVRAFIFSALLQVITTHEMAPKVFSPMRSVDNAALLCSAEKGHACKSRMVALYARSEPEIQNSPIAPA